MSLTRTCKVSLNNLQNLHQPSVHWMLYLLITIQSASFTHLYPPCRFVKPTDKLLARPQDQLCILILPETPVTPMCLLSHVLAFPRPALPHSLGILKCSSPSVLMWWPTRRLLEALEIGSQEKKGMPGEEGKPKEPVLPSFLLHTKAPGEAEPI